MLVRDALQARRAARSDDVQDTFASLPEAFRRDPGGARAGMLRRLSASRVFSVGQRAGALKSAQRRSGRPFWLDLRQRVIVKALVSRHAGSGVARAGALSRHVAYLGRSGAGMEGSRPEFFDRSRDGLDAREPTGGWTEDRHHFRFIISPEHGDRIADLRAYVREVMARVSADLGELRLEWVATCHFDTDQPHAHVLVRGHREDARDLVIPRQYMGYGFRGRAQEVAQELLGDLSRVDAERRIWRETQADRFTPLDRRLIATADAELFVPDGVGRDDAWSALRRGRLRRLEALGLATRRGNSFQLDPDLERRLRKLQLDKDVIRTLAQRRLESGSDIRVLEGRVRGEVVRSGFHDELGASPFVLVRDRSGMEHYARLPAGTALPESGRTVEVLRTERGAQIVQKGLGLDSGR